MTCELFIGPMKSGKTTKLFSRLLRINGINNSIKICYINNTLDTRSESDFSSHNLVYADISDKIDIIKIESGSLKSYTDQISKYQVIGIDEIQFFSEEDIDSLLELFKTPNTHFHILMAGLNGDHMGKPIGFAHKIMPFCTNIELLYALCYDCSIKNNSYTDERATMSYRNDKAQGTIHIGNMDSYTPLCVECYKNRTNNK